MDETASAFKMTEMSHPFAFFAKNRPNYLIILDIFR